MDFLSAYTYSLPEELVAHEPAVPRDSARLFVYYTQSGRIELRQVHDLPLILGKVRVVYNDTRVLPARLAGVGNEEKPVELLVLVDQGFGEGGEVRALVNRFTENGEVIMIGKHTFTVLDNREKSMCMRFSGSSTDLEVLLRERGETPLPPYIHSRVTEEERRLQYQTMFADDAPSVAAPTASLHFTPELTACMSKAGATWSPVTLQVGLGTFAPIFPEHFESGTLHTEYFCIPDQSSREIKEASENGVPIVAVGTTVVRALESGKEAILKGEGVVASTDIFIRPPYTFTIPDVLMTNFHVPRSSLMCLVDAFLEHKGAQHSLLELYEIAIKERFRFYSFGDAMLVV